MFVFLSAKDECHTSDSLHQHSITPLTALGCRQVDKKLATNGPVTGPIQERRQCRSAQPYVYSPYHSFA